MPSPSDPVPLDASRDPHSPGDPPRENAPGDHDTGPGGNRLLWLLAVVAVAFALLRPISPTAWLGLIDWQTMGALTGLLAITQGVERSGVLQGAARALLARTGTARQLALVLCAVAAVLSALVTNDVSLFLLVPLTRELAAQAHLPLARLVALEALAVNAGSSLTPIGNPQNLYLWHRSGESFGGFIAMMGPSVAVMLGLLLATILITMPRTPITIAPVARRAPTQPRLLALSCALFVGFVVALEMHQWVPALAVVLVVYAVWHRQVLRRLDWALLATFALMFVDLHQLVALPQVAGLMARLPLDQPLPAYLAAIAASQVISNVPATLLLADHMPHLAVLAIGVNVGGFGFVLGSMANLIALWLARVPGGLAEFHRISLPFLAVCAVLVGWVAL
ncbi:citrate transporter [Roseateles aquatilis]|uniref:Citrate transporter n=1 Tax=Roseateles aquatilis TaxID=431061 RepID=A0A246IUD4_9BURK|nr:SLC13 family permease [Roseateles aquatilis]OWQ83806.1 citrate transporter [Roseateles aquatilis]